ncbi:MAG: N-acetylneuraminate synthase [Acidobacteriota bacterium]
MKTNKTYIIAEAGVNHNGSLELAMKLVEAAKEAGADAVKFQTFKAEKLVSRKAVKAEYQMNSTSADESQFNMIKKLELSQDDHIKLFDFCKKTGIEFLSSPFDEESADFLDEIGLEIFKIPSGEITNIPFLKHIAQKGKKIILSTGMSQLGEIEEALSVINAYNTGDVVLLHCVTEYPAPYGEINLRAMLTLKQAFNIRVGYSDHSPGIEISLAAIALGAEVIEKHFTLDKNLPGPDHKASLEPEELKNMIASIRNIEKSLGDGIKRPAECEIKNIHIARKSLVAVTDIAEGELISLSNISVKRPGSGILPKYLEQVIGKRARTSIAAEEVMTWDKIC